MAFMSLLSDLFDSYPKTIQEALAHSHWRKAAHDEYTDLIKNKHGI